VSVALCIAMCGLFSHQSHVAHGGFHTPTCCCGLRLLACVSCSVCCRVCCSAICSACCSMCVAVCVAVRIAVRIAVLQNVLL